MSNFITKKDRLQQLMEKKELSDDEINEAYSIAEELKINNEESTVDLDTIMDLNIILQNLRTERKSLEIQAEIRKEKKKISDLKKHMDKKSVWCNVCGKYVLEDDEDT